MSSCPVQSVRRIHRRVHSFTARSTSCISFRCHTGHGRCVRLSRAPDMASGPAVTEIDRSGQLPSAGRWGAGFPKRAHHDVALATSSIGGWRSFMRSKSSPRGDASTSSSSDRPTTCGSMSPSSYARRRSGKRRGPRYPRSPRQARPTRSSFDAPALREPATRSNREWCRAGLRPRPRARRAPPRPRRVKIRRRRDSTRAA